MSSCADKELKHYVSHKNNRRNQNVHDSLSGSAYVNQKSVLIEVEPITTTAQVSLDLWASVFLNVQALAG